MWWFEGMLRRRNLIRAVACGPGLVALAGLPGCGFALRQAPELPFQRIQLEGFAAGSSMAEELKRELGRSVQVVSADGRPDVLLRVTQDRRDKAIVAATAAGQLREVQLKLHFEFRLNAASGRELVPVTGMLLARNMSYNETFALAKEQEEDQLYAAMQSEVVMQVLRRLSKAPHA